VAGAVWAVRTAGSGHHASGKPTTGRLTRAAHPEPPERLVLQVTPAPYQLPSAISRAVVLAGSGPGLLIAGGLTPQQASTSTVLRLDPVTGQTTPAGRLTIPTHDAGGAVLGGRAFVFGGGSAASIASVQSAVTDRTWPAVGQLPRVRSDLSAVTVDGKAYLLGGYDGSRYDSSVLATTDGRRFTVAARLPVPVRYPAVAALGSRIWVFGGQTPSGLTDEIQQVDTATGKVTVTGRLPTPLAHAAGFTLGGRLYVAGGQTALTATHPSGQVLQYTPPSGQAPGHTTVAGQLPVPVANGAAAVLGSTAYLLGGDTGGAAVPSVTTFRLVRPAAAIPAMAAGPGTAPGSPILASAPWLAPAHGRGYLRPGSDPSALPGDILIADHLNNRLLIVDPQGRVRWMFPRPGDLAHGQSFLVPDDAFFSPDGKDIIATEEDNFVISVIDVATHRISYRYGVPGVPGSGPDHLNNPDDAMIAPNGRIVTADIKNCRILTIAPPAHRPLHVIDQTTNLCTHAPPHRFGSPNGAFPLTDGRYLITEINGDWADEMSLTGQVSWSTRPPGVLYPSDSNEVYPGRYLTADYSDPGQVAEFTAGGRLLWRFRGLNKPSLALPLPNGDVLVNDDYNDRVIVIDPATNRIVWQYGHTGVPGTGPGYLHDPDGVDLTPPDSLLITHSATMGLPK
jgi:outer membrane protein assembly factor BamB